VELLHDWDLIDLSQDAWLVSSPEGELLGYAAVIPRGSNLQQDFFVSPSWNGEALGLDLLARCEARSLAITSQREESEETLGVIYIAHVNARDTKTARLAGFSPEKYHFQLTINLDRPLEEPDWPEGLTLRTVQPERDLNAVYQLIQDAFARPGRTAQPFAAWESFMLRSDIFEPDLWFLAFSGLKLIGACLCYAYPEMGWVRQLGVEKSWRRRGLGSAFLKYTFQIFKARGLNKVGLGMEATNLGADAFYQSIGMERTRQYDEFNKVLKSSV
jgi:GNAT superfamily N-acetyltransferase